jgi:hypothetical protein
MYQPTFSCLILPEDGDCNVRQNVWTASTYNVTKLYKLKLSIRDGLQTLGIQLDSKQASCYGS